MALRWRDVDLLLDQVSINRSMHHLRDGSTVFRQPKKARSRRMITLPLSAGIVLRQHRDEHEAHRASLGMQWTDEDLVFCHWEGSPLLPDSVTQFWRRITRQPGLDGVRLHDARHTHATLMLKQGGQPEGSPGTAGPLQHSRHHRHLLPRGPGAARGGRTSLRSELVHRRSATRERSQRKLARC